MNPELVMPQLLKQQAIDHPDDVFLTEVGGRSVTRSEAYELMESWASAMHAAGVGPGDTALIMAPTGVTAISAWLGIARLRALEVPINAQYRGSMLAYIINDSRARVLVLHEQHLEQISEVVGECPGLERLVVIAADEDAPLGEVPGVEVSGVRSFLAAGIDASDVAYPEPHDVAAIVYTSGTTGPSKGVLVPWAQLHATAEWLGPKGELTPDDVAYVPFPFYHVSVKGPVYTMLLCRGRAVIRDRFASAEFWPDVHEHGCTYAILLGGMARLIQMAPPRDDDADNPLRVAGMVPALPDVKEFEARFGMRVGTIFNMTETSVPIRSENWQITDPASAGKVRPGCEVRLVDANDNEVPIGEVGELIVRTDAPWELNRGYWGKPEATAKAWQNGWFHTGDGFRCDEEGNYFFVDRFKDAIRRRGENISSIEVEALISAHPDVEAAAAIGVPAVIGDEDVKVIVVRVPGSTLDAQTLIADLEARMPRFMVPRYVEFVSELPMTPTLKVRKVVLREAGITASTYDRETAAPESALAASNPPVA